MKSEGEVAVELSFPSIERTMSSGKSSKKSEVFCGILFCLLLLFVSENMFDS